MPSRWDFLYDQKPVPLAQHLSDEVAKLLSADLDRWPLPLSELDLEAGREFRALAMGEVARPAAQVFHEAFQLARWDLTHEVEAYDEYMRNRRWLERGLAPQDKPALLFVGRWLLDQMTSLREATQGRIRRADLLKILEATEKKWGQAA